MLRAAALLGVEFAVTDLTAVLGRSVADLVPALDEARATGVLTDAGGAGLAFRHPLIREALYAELPTAVRGAWHRDAGHALAAAGAAPDRVARQLLRALGGPGSAARGLRRGRSPDRGSTPRRSAASTAARAWPSRSSARRSARRGQRTGPVDEWMLDWLATSADSLVGQAPGVAAELLAQAVGRHPGRIGPARVAGQPARRRALPDRRPGGGRAGGGAGARPRHRPDLVVDLHWTLAQCRMLAGSADESFATLDQALAAPGITAKHRARLLVLAARTYLYLGDVEAAGREADSALAVGRRRRTTPGRPAGRCTCWPLVATIQGDLADALPLYDRAPRGDRDRPRAVPTSACCCRSTRRSRSATSTGTTRRWPPPSGPGSSPTRSARRSGWRRRTACSARRSIETGRWDDALTEIATVPDGPEGARRGLRRARHRRRDQLPPQRAGARPAATWPPPSRTRSGSGSGRSRR